MHLTVSPGLIVYNKNWITFILKFENFPESLLFELLNFSKTPTILLIHYFQKNPGNWYAMIQLFLFYENKN